MDKGEEDPIRKREIPAAAVEAKEAAPHSSMYTQDVYTEGNFAQLKPFFPPRAASGGLQVPQIEEHEFPAVHRHISTYSRSLPIAAEEKAAEDGIVDFGGASGGEGSFGWYSAHPVSEEEDLKEGKSGKEEEEEKAL